MANPIKEKGFTADGNGNPLIADQQSNVADPAAITADAVAVTFTANTPTPAATQTIADGTVPTVAELGQWVANAEVVMEALQADITAVRTTVVSLNAVLESHGLTADA